MATNEQILTEIAVLKEQNKNHAIETGKVLVVAKSNERVLRGYNGKVGIVSRVKTIEDNSADRDDKIDRSFKIFYGTSASVIGAIVLDLISRWTLK